MPLHLLELVRRVTGVFKCLNISYIAIGQKDYIRLQCYTISLSVFMVVAITIRTIRTYQQLYIY